MVINPLLTTHWKTVT